MQKHEIEVGREYECTYPNASRRTALVVTVISIDGVGDCVVKLKNGKRELYHCAWLEPANSDCTDTSRLSSGKE